MTACLSGVTQRVRCGKQATNQEVFVNETFDRKSQTHKTGEMEESAEHVLVTTIDRNGRTETGSGY